MINKRITRLMILFCILFLALIGYLTYFEIELSDSIEQNAYNQRLWMHEEDVQRGSIYDRNGTVLAYSDGSKRIYPYNSLYSHVIGYNTKTYGKSQLELTYNKQLLGNNGITDALNLSKITSGYDLNLTIDHKLQNTASNLLGSRNGAIVALNPKSGEILALVSKPDFNPNESSLVENWSNLTTNETSPLLPRATSGLYAPGSTFKIITASSAIENGLSNKSFNDTGSIEIGNKVFTNYGGRAYGTITMDQGLVFSSNVVFCSLGLELGQERLKATAENFGFNKKIDFDINTAKSIFPQKHFSKEQQAALGIGQSEILATPLQMALVASSIANGGNMMKPFIVKSITNKTGFSVNETKPQILYKTVSSDIASRLKDAMIDVVNKGTGTSAAVSGIQVAAKTGTAENEQSERNSGKEHTWIVAFAPADNPQIAVAVMMEYSGGSGGANCGPVARNLISQYLYGY